MIDIIDKSECTGCYACVNACPKHCVSMAEDDEEFRYPVIDSSICIGCDMCSSVCPTLNGIGKSKIQQAYAAYAIDETIRCNSSSGGIFSLLADYIIENNGVVFGAGFNTDFQVEHICIKKKDDLHKLRMAKYVQSSIGNTFKEAKAILDTGCTVLFTGTSCQIAGLRNYLKKDYDNLYTQDIVCYGVPSPLVWKKHLNYMNKKNGDLKSIEFRNKEFGWRNYSIKYSFEDKCIYSLAREDIYLNLYFDRLIMRPSCYRCIFKADNRQSDITLGDFWGIEKYWDGIDVDKGVSLVICNSMKGLKLLSYISNEINRVEVDISDAVKNNSAIIDSVNVNPLRESFMKKVARATYKSAVKQYSKLLKPRALKDLLVTDFKQIKAEKGLFFSTAWFIKHYKDYHN